MGAAVDSPCSGVILLYVECSIVWLSSHLFSIKVHSRLLQEKCVFTNSQ